MILYTQQITSIWSCQNKTDQKSANFSHFVSMLNRLKVLRIRIRDRCFIDPWIRDGKKSGSGITIPDHTVGAESLCRCRWKVRYLKPLDLWSQMTLKCFHYEFERWICRPLSWYNMNCLEFVIILLPVRKVNKLSVPIFLKKKEILPLEGGKIFFFILREMLFYGLRWVWSEK